MEGYSLASIFAAFLTFMNYSGLRNADESFPCPVNLFWCEVLHLSAFFGRGRREKYPPKWHPTFTRIAVETGRSKSAPRFFGLLRSVKTGCFTCSRWQCKITENNLWSSGKFTWVVLLGLQSFFAIQNLTNRWLWKHIKTFVPAQERQVRITTGSRNTLGGRFSYPWFCIVGVLSSTMPSAKHLGVLCLYMVIVFELHPRNAALGCSGSSYTVRWLGG